MNLKFQVQMTVKYMHSFMLYHNYTRLSGIFSLMLGIVGVVMACTNALAGQLQGAAMGGFIALMFFVVTPVSIKNAAKRQVQQTKAFQKPLEYELTEEGIVTRQDEAEALTKWEEFRKVVQAGPIMILYITRVRAIIFPKECMGEQYQGIVAEIRKHMPAKQVKVK